MPSAAESQNLDASQLADFYTIKFSDLFDTENEDKSGPKNAIATLLQACERDGFFYLDLNGSHSKKMWEDLEKVNSLTREWFEQPRETKLSTPTVSLAHGFKATGNQSGAVKDLKDGFEALKIGRHELQGRWALSDVVSDNLKLFDEFTASCHFILKVILESLSDGLELRGSDRFETHHRDDLRSKSTLYFLHYPPGQDNPREVGQNMHTDIGTLTLLFAPQWGLQVVSPKTGEWHYVEPRAGHAIINVADTLRFLSRRRFRSALHRVLPIGAIQKEHRYSTSYFLRAHDATEFFDSDNSASSAKDWYMKKYKEYELPHDTQSLSTTLSGGMRQELKASY